MYLAHPTSYPHPPVTSRRLSRRQCAHLREAGLPYAPQVVLRLKVHPELWLGRENYCKPYCHFRRYRRPSIDDGGQVLAGDFERLCRLRDGHLQGHEIEFTEDLARVRRVVHLRGLFNGSRHNPPRWRGLPEAEGYTIILINLDRPGS